MVITRYILKNLLGVAVFVTVILTLLIILTQSLRFLELIIESGAPPGSFFQLILLAIPRFLEVILPLSLVTAVLFVYNKMISENELVVMRAAGFTQHALMRPALYLAGFGFISVLFLTLWGAPTSHSRLEELRDKIKTEYASLLLREGVFNTIGDGVMIYMDERRSDGTLGGLVIHDTRKKDEPPVTIIANRGQILTRNGDSAEVVVFDGRRENYKPETGSLDILNFDQYTLEVINARNDPRLRWRKADERTIFELMHPSRQVLESQRLRHLFMVEFYRRMAAPLTVFSFIGVALACLLVGSFNRRGQSRRIVLASALIIGMQSLYLGLSNAMEAHSWAISALYLAIILPLLASIYAISPVGEALRQRLVSRKAIKRSGA